MAADSNPLAASFTLGETATAVRLQEAAEVPDRLSGFVGATATNIYISRWLDFGKTRASSRSLRGTGLLVVPARRKASSRSSYVFAGIWNSLHTNHDYAKAAGELGGWYEFDWYVGIAATFAGGFSGNIQYVEFLSPGPGVRLGQEPDLQRGVRRLAVPRQVLVEALRSRSCTRPAVRLVRQRRPGHLPGTRRQPGHHPRRRRRIPDRALSLPDGDRSRLQRLLR